VNLIGEHTDYNHGFVLPVAIDRDILLLARPRADSSVNLHNTEPVFASRTFAVGFDIEPAEAGDWSNYVRGAAQMLAHHIERPLLGMDALVSAAPPQGTPRGAGVSSSSALTVVAALALAWLNDWSPERISFARQCSEAEWYVGTRGGIMDQFISLLALPEHALFLDCRPLGNGDYHLNHVPMPSGYRVLVANTGIRHTNVGGEFNLRVAACRAGVACLRERVADITHLRDVQHIAWEELAHIVPEVMSVSQARERGADLANLPLRDPDALLRVRACCRHVHSENRRVQAAVDALSAGDVTRVGELLDEAHTSARDDYDVSCPELEAMVNAVKKIDGTYGARLTGAGWGGCVVALVHQDALLDVESILPELYGASTGIEPHVFVCQPSSRAEHLLTLSV